jgi:hypothetical protein
MRDCLNALKSRQLSNNLRHRVPADARRLRSSSAATVSPWPALSPPCASHLTAEQCGSSDQSIGRGDQACQGKTVITSSRPRTFSGIDDRSIIAKDGAGRQVCLIDMRRPEDVHHLLSCGEKVIGNDPPMASPPDRFRAHNRASVPAAPLPEPRHATGEGRRQGIVRIVAKAAYPPIGIR